MNQKLTGFLLFVLGAGVGAFATYKFVEQKYKRIADEEIESVKEAFKKKVEKKKDKKPVETKKAVTAAPASVTPKSLGYATAVPEKPKQIYIISPDEFGEFSTYETVSLTYYSDGVLTTQDDQIIDDVENYVGKGFETHFGEYEDDSVFVRNDDKQTDYEILRDNRTYQEVVIGDQS